MKFNLKLPKIRLPNANKIQETLSETAMLGGFLMFGYGLYLIYPPLSFIICGICLFLLGFPSKGGR